MVNATFPADLLAGLDLHDGDKVEGTVYDGVVTLHVAARAESLVKEGVQVVNEFLSTWSGRFTLVGSATDARTDYLIQKHLR